jgi:hypothetical protein
MKRSGLKKNRIAELLTSMPSPLGFLPLVILLVLWQVLQSGNSPYFPPPSAWWSGLLQLASGGKCQAY